MSPEYKMHLHDFFMNEFADESDRACVILAVAVLDESLKILLKTNLAPFSGSEDPLLDGSYAPLSSFKAKVDFAHRLGLLSTQFVRDLHIIRRIRNAFAHNLHGCSFGDYSVKNRLTELTRSSGINEKFPKTRKRFPSGPKGDFQITISWMLWRLESLIKEVKPFKIAELEVWYLDIDEEKLDTLLKESNKK